MSVLAGLFPPVEPRCEAHMDATCWQCEGTGRLPCARHEPQGYAEPDCECCEARECDVCEGHGWARWCFHPDCEACREVHLYNRALSRAETRWKEERAGIREP